MQLQPGQFCSFVSALADSSTLPLSDRDLGPHNPGLPAKTQLPEDVRSPLHLLSGGRAVTALPGTLDGAGSALECQRRLPAAPGKRGLRHCFGHDRIWLDERRPGRALEGQDRWG